MFPLLPCGSIPFDCYRRFPLCPRAARRSCQNHEAYQSPAHCVKLLFDRHLSRLDQIHTGKIVVGDAKDANVDCKSHCRKTELNSGAILRREYAFPGSACT